MERDLYNSQIAMTSNSNNFDYEENFQTRPRSESTFTVIQNLPRRQRFQQVVKG